jgi:hypothetical protein
MKELAGKTRCYGGDEADDDKKEALMRMQLCWLSDERRGRD